MPSTFFKVLATHSCKLTKPADDSNQPSDLHPSDYKGKQMPDEYPQPVLRLHCLNRHASVLFRFPSDVDEHDDVDEDTNEDPFIPYAIEAPDLAADDNDLLDLLHTHDGGQGKLNAKKNEPYRPNLLKIWQEGNQVAQRAPRLPRCRLATRRRLNHPRDDLARHMCWFHRQNVDRRSEKCRRTQKLRVSAGGQSWACLFPVLEFQYHIRLHMHKKTSINRNNLIIV
ncbi:hypothetical protein BKA58DRAFT_406499 [Alternaria rosae]|uniref:uncharacterized protein n=1 Tax=Alternaria rosae TaxID=1187941 RepID=UPI001E8D3092|nr:uncharacterized protein BKA58DRAFT_406499 [Alternaria rosae]KAH6851415.1 hypothetical protein BKA58DRAFT_406499 [Alternaria rosae]